LDSCFLLDAILLVLNNHTPPISALHQRTTAINILRLTTHTCGAALALCMRMAVDVRLNIQGVESGCGMERRGQVSIIMG